LDIESPEFFQAHNAQNETNVHNLIVAGVGVNKLIFGKLLAIGLVGYLFALGLICRRSPRFAKQVNRFAIPVPRIYHALAILAIVAIVETSPARKRGEINEYAISSIAFLILLNPINRNIFVPNGPSKLKSGAKNAPTTQTLIAGSTNAESEGRRAA